MGVEACRRVPVICASYRWLAKFKLLGEHMYQLSFDEATAVSGGFASGIGGSGGFFDFSGGQSFFGLDDLGLKGKKPPAPPTPSTPPEKEDDKKKPPESSGDSTRTTNNNNCNGSTRTGTLEVRGAFFNVKLTVSECVAAK